MASLLSLILLTTAAAWAELQVLPARVVLTEAQTTAQVALTQKGSKSAKYRVNAVAFRMDKEGVMTEENDPTKSQNSAVDFFRYSPRQLTLEPGIEQIIRLQLKFPQEAAVIIPEADYHAHLNIELIEEGDDSTAVRPAANTQSLPPDPPTRVSVIVRKGAPELKLSLENFKTLTAKDGSFAYSVDVIKAGPALLHADFVVQHKAIGEEKSTVVAQTNAVTSFIEKRVVTQTLNVASLPPGRLTLEVREPVSDGAKVLATTSIDTGPLPVLPSASRDPAAVL